LSRRVRIPVRNESRQLLFPASSPRWIWYRALLRFVHHGATEEVAEFNTNSIRSKQFKIIAWCTQNMHKSSTTPTSGCINTSTTTSSPGSTGSTSAPPCAATTRDPAARVLPQHCHTPRLLVTRLHRLYVNLVVRHEYSSSCRSGSTSTTPYTAATSSFGRTTTSTTYLD
jgi:hypothetical protein